MPDPSPFGMTGIPGANPGGSNIPAPSPAAPSSPSLGGGTNPFTPTFPGGAQTPPLSSSLNLATMNPSSLFGFGNGTKDPLHDITKALGKAGFSAGVAGELANFLQSGAGFNPAVAQALIAAMQPGVQRKEADILEQFGSQGLRNSSNAAIAFGDFLSQEQLNEDQVWANLYEDSVKNYMGVLLSGKGNPPKGLFDNLMTFLSTTSQAALNGAKAADGGGK
jgi:hypothetical protein